jgi:dipeptidase E
MDLLLLSNSTNVGEGYLAYSKGIIRDFLLDHEDQIVFIPYAGVTVTWEEYTNQVNDALSGIGLKVIPVDQDKDPRWMVQNASAIMVGGGNSFQLLKLLYDQGLLGIIRDRVIAGIPYIGWSAGANIACPTIKTTNDMPIVELPSLQALGLINFQVNPHYTEEILPNHGGESRAMRIEEYIKVNPGSKVLGLPEGMILRQSGTNFKLIGEKGCKIFQNGMVSVWINSDEELNDFLYDKSFK